MGIYLVFFYSIKIVSSQISSSNHYKINKNFCFTIFGRTTSIFRFFKKAFYYKNFNNYNGSVFLFLFIYIRFSFLVLSYPTLSRYRKIETKNKLFKKLYLLSICVWPILKMKILYI